MVNTHPLPSTGFLRLWQIIGQKDLKKKIIQFKSSIIEHLSDVNNLLAIVCKEYSITRDWLDQIVICPEDVEEIRNGDLPLSCLRAHIEYHLDDQRKWQERRQEISQRRTE